jgi:hypothetical protein
MAGLRGVGRFVIVLGVVLAVLRLAHLGVPLVVADARPGPFVLAGLDEVAARVGFVPIEPAYHPVTLGDRPTSIAAWLVPRPTVEIVWQADRFLSVTEHRGGSMPDHPPVSQPLDGVPDSRWWQQDGRSYLVVRHGTLWITLVTDLPTRDLHRMVDTLTPVEATVRGPQGR